MPADAVRRIVLAGGGTGGHLYPGLVVADELRRLDPACELTFFGTPRPLEVELVARAGWPHVALDVEPLPTLRRNPWRFFSRNWQAYRTCRRWLRDQRVSGVIGLGGYASAPCLAAARRLRIPSVLLEQNAIPGRVTALFASRAAHICLAFDACRRLLASRRCVFTGNPIRPEIARLCDRAAPPQRQNPRTLLVVGGSQGAAGINAAMQELVRHDANLFDGWRIVHQTGPLDLEPVRQTYAEHGLDATTAAFFNDLPELYAEADLIISRAGGTTLAELACVGAPCVLIPYPAAADHHQDRNAEAFAHEGAAVIVHQQPSPAETASALGRALREHMHDEPRRLEMSTALRRNARPAAAAEVARLVLALPSRS